MLFQSHSRWTTHSWLTFYWQWIRHVWKMWLSPCTFVLGVFSTERGSFCVAEDCYSLSRAWHIPLFREGQCSDLSYNFLNKSSCSHAQSAGHAILWNEDVEEIRGGQNLLNTRVYIAQNSSQTDHACYTTLYGMEDAFLWTNAMCKVASTLSALPAMQA